MSDTSESDSELVEQKEEVSQPVEVPETPQKTPKRVMSEAQKASFQKMQAKRKEMLELRKQQKQEAQIKAEKKSKAKPKKKVESDSSSEEEIDRKVRKGKQVVYNYYYSPQAMPTYDNHISKPKKGRKPIIEVSSSDSDSEPETAKKPPSPKPVQKLPLKISFG